MILISLLTVARSHVLFTGNSTFQWRSPSSSSPVKSGKSATWSTSDSCILTLCRDGNDGPWSTFAIRVGTPAQVFRVLASTTVPETWVIGKDGCIATDSPGCANDRGNLYNNSTSSTWKFQGNYALGVELNLPYTENYDNGGYGYDTLGVGYPGTESEVLEQVFWLIDSFIQDLAVQPWTNKLLQPSIRKTSIWEVWD